MKSREEYLKKYFNYAHPLSHVSKDVLRERCENIDIRSREYLPLFIRLGPRPRLRDLKDLNVHKVITLLRTQENPWPIRSKCSELGIAHEMLPLDSRNNSMSPRDNYVDFAAHVGINISYRYVTYVHCAAGIHRTGMIAYLMLRQACQFSHQGAIEMLRIMRPICVDQHRGRLNLVKFWWDSFYADPEGEPHSEYNIAGKAHEGEPIPGITGKWDVDPLEYVSKFEGSVHTEAGWEVVPPLDEEEDEDAD